MLEFYINMVSDLEKAQVIFKLARKDNWNNCYDRVEHFKRFQNLQEILKELSKKCWIIIHNKGKFTGISLNTQYKKEITEFVEKEMPHIKGMIE
ncbi:hypothetical protein HYW76_03560 [Candidatus Pacearchaeota archaeon]|nr:hypothetical protein [Candidatus Pacearchaeota archaeon]